MPYQNQTFRISADSGAQLEVELVEVTDLGAPGATIEDKGKRRPFSLVFSGPMDPVFPQGIYRLEHDKFEALHVFFVPIGPDSKGMRYEVVFT